MQMSNNVPPTEALSALGWDTLEIQSQKLEVRLFKVLYNQGHQSLKDLFTKKLGN